MRFVLLFILSFIPFVAKAQSGAVDKKFGVHGIHISSVSSGQDKGEVVALKSNGRLIAAGVADEFNKKDVGVIQIMPDGHIDPKFGRKGRAVVALGGQEFVYGVVITKDQKIVIGGYSVRGSHADFYLLRLNVDGSVDTSFGKNGRVVTDFGGYDELHYLVQDEQGRLIAAGFSKDKNHSNIIVARYTPQGELDPSFNQAGWVVSDFTKMDRAFGVALSKTGQLVVTGAVRKGSSDDCFVARYQPDGFLDSTFGQDGWRIVKLSARQDMCSSVAVMEDGRIVVAGFAKRAKTWTDMAIARLLPTGDMDTTFGKGGDISFDVKGGHDVVHALGVRADGSILIAGDYQRFIGDFYRSHLRGMVMTRLTVEGKMDMSFGNQGWFLPDFGGEEDAGCEGLVLTPNGKTVLVGFARKNFALTRVIESSSKP